MSIITSYEATPWAASLDKNQKTEYVPDLMARYVQQSIFYKMVNYQVDLGAMRTGQVVFTQRLTAPPNIASLDNRALWLPQLYTDSRQIVITAARYGDKIQLHKYDDRITYWRENGAAGLRAIMANDLAPHMVQTLDMLARNAFLSSHFKLFAGGATGFDNIAADDTFDVGVGRGLKLRMEYMPDVVTNPLMAICSPAATYSVRAAASGEWLTRNQYANPSILVNGEIGMYEDVRYVTSPMMTLWNCGTVLQQTYATASIAVGDGSPDPATTAVDGVWKVGQEGATHSIAVNSTTGFSVGDYVTFHTVRNASADATHVLNGVQWDHAYNLQRRIVTVVDSTHLAFDEPITVDWYQTDLGGTNFAYITKGRPIHACIFLLGPNAVVGGVIMPPQTYNPVPIDDTEAVWRFSWDAYMKYQQFMTNRMLVYFYAGPIDVNGTVTNL
jgi:hypothetical protein